MPGVVILTRLGRPSGAKILERLCIAGEPVVAVIAEPRGALLFRKGYAAFVLEAFRRHGWRWLVHKAIDLLKSRITDGDQFDILAFARKYDVPVHIVRNHNSKRTISLLQQIKPDLVITANTRLLKGEVLRQARVATINIHKSKLPLYAGLDSIFWAVYFGEREIGVTVHLVDSELDTGDIIVQRTFPIVSGDTLDTLDQKANLLGAHLMLEAVRGICEGTIQRTKQNAAERSYYSWPNPSQRRELARRMPGGCVP